MTPSLTALTVSLALSLSGASLLFTAQAAAQSTPPALTDAGNTDQKACDGLMSGDACVRSGGSGGTCRPQAGDPKLLVCDNTISDKGDVACAGKAKGAPCPLPTGASGVCGADETNPNQMRCIDMSPANPRKACSLAAAAAGGTTSDAPWLTIAALGIAAACVRRKRH